MRCTHRFFVGEAPPTAGKPEGTEPTPSGESEEVETNWDECTKTFDAMELKDELLRGTVFGPSLVLRRLFKVLSRATPFSAHQALMW